MADPVVDNGALSDIKASGKTLSSDATVFATELVTATEGGARVDLAKAEDSAHSSGDYGFQVLAVRKDTATGLASDGDYHPLLVDDVGKLWVNVGEIPAAAKTTDSISVALDTGSQTDNLTSLTPKYYSATLAAAQTDSSLIAAVTNKKIKVHALSVTCGSSATTLTLESGTSTRVHKIDMGAYGGSILPFSPVGWFATAASAALTGTTSSGSSVEITLQYTEVD